MTDDKLFFCWHLTKAAHDCGLAAKEYSDSGGFEYQFADPMTRVLIKGTKSLDKQEAFLSACQQLESYFNSKPNVQDIHFRT